PRQATGCPPAWMPAHLASQCFAFPAANPFAESARPQPGRYYTESLPYRCYWHPPPAWPVAPAKPSSVPQPAVSGLCAWCVVLVRSMIMNQPSGQQYGRQAREGGVDKKGHIAITVDNDPREPAEELSRQRHQG